MVPSDAPPAVNGDCRESPVGDMENSSAAANQQQIPVAKTGGAVDHAVDFEGDGIAAEIEHADRTSRAADRHLETFIAPVNDRRIDQPAIEVEAERDRQAMGKAGDPRPRIAGSAIKQHAGKAGDAFDIVIASLQQRIAVIAHKGCRRFTVDKNLVRQATD